MSHDTGVSPSGRRGMPRLWLRSSFGLFVGFWTALLAGAYFAISALVLLIVWPVPRWRRRAVGAALRWARALAELERRRLALFLGSDSSAYYRASRAVRYLAIRTMVGLLGAVVLLLILVGLVVGPGAILEVWASDFTFTGALWRTGYMLGLGLVSLYLALTGIVGVATVERVLARTFLGLSREEVLAHRVETLSTTRAEVVDAVNDERRRIERDLHDGVQQRLVSLGLLIGRARRSADASKTSGLLLQAHEEAQLVLRDLREVAWRVYPAALSAGGLRPALDMVAERAGLPVRIRYELDMRLDEARETAVYFVVSEAVTNAAKHSGADSVTVHLRRATSGTVLTVVDNGSGGAHADAAGLSGLARRVAALDGEFRVSSPVGGPTEITAVLPCG